MDRARQMGDIIGAYKVADMYKNGCFVERDPDKYKAVIEELYPRVEHARQLDEPLPEIFTRLARIRTEEGNTAEALRLYDAVRDFLARRIRAHPFFGDLNIMKWMIGDIYKLRDFDRESFALYDLYWLLNSPVRVRFCFEENAHEAEAVPEGDQLSIRFDEKWYRTIDDFFRKAELDGELLTSRYEELYCFEVL